MTDQMKKPISNRPFEQEVEIITSRSSGPGGQNVNKTESKVELRFNVNASSLLSEDEKARILNKQKRRISQDGILQVLAQESRSQLANRQLAFKRFYQYLQESMKKDKKRIPTKPSKQVVAKRIARKKKHSEKKQFRGRIDPHH
jgi:ribosome-associated protein